MEQGTTTGDMILPRELQERAEEAIQNSKIKVIGHIGDLGYVKIKQGDTSEIYTFPGRWAYDKIGSHALLNPDKITQISDGTFDGFKEHIYHLKDCTIELRYEHLSTALQVFNEDSKKRKQAIQKLEEVLK